MIMIVGADAGEVRLHDYSYGFEVPRRPHARQHQQLRRVHGSGAQQHLT